MTSRFKYKKSVTALTDGDVEVSKYESENSGMTICIAKVNGPLVGGYLTFATEAFDDDGLPHTLEHLVFLGSEKYPYKGVLDMIASRCLAQGTNAFTEKDHTCYTVSTAGDEGFLKILPIFLDHLLFPTLTDASYTTEVHHINEKGEDGGVLYCEMQDVENTSANLSHLSMLRAMYPGHCGYKSETSGLLKNLRESTTIEKVRAYHEKLYRPENLCIIIVGQVDAIKVFESLIPVEESILQKGVKPKFTRPWQTPVPPLSKSIEMDVEYPSDDVEYGDLIAAWRGPHVNNFTHVIAMTILMDYFTDTSVAPFKQQCVEIEDPLCNDVYYHIIKNSTTCICMHFSSVPVEKLEMLKNKLFMVFKDIVVGKEIDMKRITTLIMKTKLHILRNMEDSPHEYLSISLTTDFLYGSDIKHLEKRLKMIPAIEKLFDEDTQFWIDLVKKYLVDGNHVVIAGTPSSKLAEEIAKEESKRVEAQQKRLGLDGLNKKAEILRKSVELNKMPPSKEILPSVTVISAGSIKFHQIKRTSNAWKCESDVNFSVSKMPCRFQVDCIQTHFVRLLVMIDTSHLSKPSRMYLPLLIELLGECAIRRNEELVPYEEVVKQLEDDTITVSASLGFGYSRFFCTSYAQAICLHMMVVEEKYVQSVKWIREILFDVFFEPSRIKSTIRKMVAEVPAIKQRGSSIVISMMKNMYFQPCSNQWSAIIFRQHRFLVSLLKEHENNPNDVVLKLNEIKEDILKPENIVVHLALNLESLRRKVNPEDAWLEFLPKTVSPKVMNSDLKKCSKFIQPIGADDVKGRIAGLGHLESAFLIQATSCIIENRTHPDYLPLIVLNSYLTQFEGPMWKGIRGKGLAYSFDLCFSQDTGLIYFFLSYSNQLVKAYEEALNIIDSHLNRNTMWDQELLVSAKATVVFQLMDMTISDLVLHSIKSYCRNSGMNFDDERELLISNVSKVTTGDLDRVGMQYLKPLFRPQTSRCTVTCNPSNIKDITEGFKK